MSSGGAKPGSPNLSRKVIPENRIQECVWTVLLAMEGEEEGVATAAIDSQVLRHDRVGGGLHHDGEDGSPGPSVEAASQLRIPFETILSSRAIVW